jgi:hypothetical protein
MSELRLITTTKGLMDPALLRKSQGFVNNENEETHWIEYYDGDELVHRSVHVTLKKGVEVEAVGGNIGP